MELPVGIHGTFKSKASYPYKEGDKAIIDCKPGYGSNKLISRLVMKDGKLQWDPPSIICTPKSCGMPSRIDNGKIIGNAFSFGNSFYYECNEGYKLNFLRTYYCSTTGEWIPDIKKAKCIPVECNKLKDPENGTVSYSSRVYGSVATYKCDRGYKLSGKEIRTCTGNGTWSEEEPKCEEIVLPQPPAVLNPPQPPVVLNPPQPPVVLNPPQPPVVLNPPQPPVVLNPPQPTDQNLPPFSIVPPILPQPLPPLKPQSKNIVITICILIIILSILFSIKNRKR